MTYGKPIEELSNKQVGIETVVEGEESKLAELNTVDVVSANADQGGEVQLGTGESKVAVEKDTTAREPGSEATAQELEVRNEALENAPTDAPEVTVDSDAVIEEDKVEQTAVEDTRTDEEKAAQESAETTEE